MRGLQIKNKLILEKDYLHIFEEIETKLNSLEANLRSFYEKNQVLDLQAEKKSLVDEIGTLNRQISGVGAQLQGKKAGATSVNVNTGQKGLDNTLKLRGDFRS